MQIIAHRGASKQFPENSIDSFRFAADHGADLVETDLRLTSDQVFVLFHDDDLKKVDGSDRLVHELTFIQLAEVLKAAGWPQLLRLDQLDSLYRRTTPFLFHIKVGGVERLLQSALDQLKLPFYLGLERPDLVGFFSPLLGRERILAFMPQPQELSIFIEQGAGIIRLWQNWLDDELIDYSHRHNCDVWIMARNASGIGETDLATLDLIAKSGADGILLNDICLARKWREQKTDDQAKRR